ncbi:MAG: alpha/beta fold hydrolase [Chloroflexi bacterium]|nr:alpha/beta fold hydrolase [Chloroflexota bacterium]
MPFYTVNNQKIHVIEAGHPNRQVALMIHGWSSSWYAMSPLIGLMSQRFRVLAIDLPGYGQSPKLPQRTTIEDYADVLAELIEQVADGPVVLVGHSMGGMTSLVIAEKYPALVERIVLICPTITGKLSTYINAVVFPITFMERFGLARLITAVEGVVVGITDRIMRPASFAERTGITEQDYSRLRSDARRSDQGLVRAECFRAMQTSNLSGRIGKIEIPSLVIWGAEDNTVPLRDSGVIADEWPQADLRILPKAGHWPHFERPDVTRRLIASFLGLPFLSEDGLAEPVGDEELQMVQEIAQFLAHSDVGNDLNLTQRTRMAAQFKRLIFAPGETIVNIRDMGSEMYLIQDGTVDVWSDPDNPGEWTQNFRKVATLRPGQITGELALFDEGLRSADLLAGDSGAVVLALDRDHVRDLCEADPVLGSRFLWNMARAMSHRVRFIQWQFRRARQRDESAKQAVR